MDVKIVKYFVLGKWTDQGRNSIDEAPKRVENHSKFSRRTKGEYECLLYNG